MSAAILHLFTHAFFKALLFLGAGSVMHGMGHVIDMRRLGGLRRVMPVTHWTFLCGSLALAGVIPFSGFWSKDEILEAVLHASEHSHAYKTIYLALFGVALVTAGLTAFYTFRAYFKTFWGEVRIPDEAHHHHGDGGVHEQAHEAHHGEQPKSFESPSVMTTPLILLAIGAVFVGLVFEGATHWIGGFLSRSTAFLPFAGFKPALHLNWLLILLSTLSAAAGIGVAFWIYVLKPGAARRIAAALRPAYTLSLNRFFLDELYSLLVVKPLGTLAWIARGFDAVIDGIVDLVGFIPRLGGRGVQPVQNGLVQFYALVMVVFLTAFVMIFALWVRQ